MIGWKSTSTASPANRMAEVGVSRMLFTAIASAPSLHSWLTTLRTSRSDRIDTAVIGTLPCRVLTDAVAVTFASPRVTCRPGPLTAVVPASNSSLAKPSGRAGTQRRVAQRVDLRGQRPFLGVEGVAGGLSVTHLVRPARCGPSCVCGAPSDSACTHATTSRKPITCRGHGGRRRARTTPASSGRPSRRSAAAA